MIPEINQFILEQIIKNNPNIKIQAIAKRNSFEIKSIDDYKVIFNDPATILFVNGKKYISKAHNEPFDKEKGLLMCLAKANGISHLLLKKLIDNAQDQSKEIESIEIATLDGKKKSKKRGD